jgi:transcription antitermination factor NusG
MRWYVLRSKPNREQALWLEASGRGFQTYYPYLRVQPVNPRSRKMRPYFPGYMFVYADLPAVGISAFSWMPYSQGLVSFDGAPAEVPEALVEAIRKRVDEANASGGEQMVGLRRGEAIVIQGGPFDGYPAIFDARVSGSERVRVLLKLLQAERMRLELPASQIRPIKHR